MKRVYWHNIVFLAALTSAVWGFKAGAGQPYVIEFYRESYICTAETERRVQDFNGNTAGIIFTVYHDYDASDSRALVGNMHNPYADSFINHLSNDVNLISVHPKTTDSEG